MSGQEWTPTTEDVRTAAGCGFIGDLEFDRWLAEHDRDLAARAWDEGHAHGAYYGPARFDPAGGYPDINPYRAEAGA